MTEIKIHVYRYIKCVFSSNLLHRDRKQNDTSKFLKIHGGDGKRRHLTGPLPPSLHPGLATNHRNVVPVLLIFFNMYHFTYTFSHAHIEAHTYTHTCMICTQEIWRQAGAGAWSGGAEQRLLFKTKASHTHIATSRAVLT